MYPPKSRPKVLAKEGKLDHGPKQRLELCGIPSLLFRYVTAGSVSHHQGTISWQNVAMNVEGRDKLVSCSSDGVEGANPGSVMQQQSEYAKRPHVIISINDLNSTFQPAHRQWRYDLYPKVQAFIDSLGE